MRASRFVLPPKRKDGVLPEKPFTTPMPPVQPPKDRTLEFDGSVLEEALAKRGVAWPIGGFAPGLYVQTCRKCAGRHMADKRATVCLPCAVVAAIDTASATDDRFAAGIAEGRRRATADVVRALGIEVLS